MVTQREVQNSAIQKRYAAQGANSIIQKIYTARSSCALYKTTRHKRKAEIEIKLLCILTEYAN
jgi:hypothetical protein